jgi:hypothetical protein
MHSPHVTHVIHVYGANFGLAGHIYTEPKPLFWVNFDAETRPDPIELLRFPRSFRTPSLT